MLLRYTTQYTYHYKSSPLSRCPVSHVSPEPWSLLPACLVSTLHCVPPPGPQALVTQVRVHYRVVTAQGDVRAGSAEHCDIVIPGVPTHPGDQLSAPATTGHTALRGRPVGPAESGICFTVFDLLNCVLCLPNTILIFMAFEHKYKCLIKLNFSLL